MTGYQPQAHPNVKVDKWTVTPELKAHVDHVYPRVNAARAYDRFRRHHMGKATRSSCWDAEFINWLEQDAEKIGETTSDGTTDYRGIPASTKQQWDAHLMGKTEGTPQ